MQIFREIKGLLIKELQLELRQKYALNGLLLYALTMVFVISLSFLRELTPESWNVMYWIILLFVAVNAIAKSFMGESDGQLLYLYTLASPIAIIAAKLIYNFFLMISLALVSLVAFLLFSGKGEIGSPGIYLVSVILGSMGFASNMTLVSAIASKAQNKSTLLAVLSFPLVVPQLLISIGVSAKAMLGVGWQETWGELVFSACFTVIIAAVSFILFPFLWRE